MYQISLMLVFLSLTAAWLALLFGAILWLMNLVGAPVFFTLLFGIVGILLAVVIVREIRMSREAKP